MTQPQIGEPDDFRLLIEGKIESDEYVRRLRARVAERSDYRPSSRVSFGAHDFIALWQCPACAHVEDRRAFCSHIGTEAHDLPGCDLVRVRFYPGWPAREDRNPSP